MAVIPYTLVDDGQKVLGDPTIVYRWPTLTFTGSDSGNPLPGIGWSDRSVQVEGTFGAGGTVVIEGSNDGTNWHTLKDPFSVAISFTATGLAQVTEISRYVRPRVSGGDGTTSVTITIVMRTQHL